MAMLLLFATSASAQSVYRYKDKDGHWIYTDQKPASDVATEALKLKVSEKSPHIAVDRVGDDRHSTFTAINQCHCIVEFGFRVTQASNVELSGERVYDEVLQPQSEKKLLDIVATGDARPAFGYQWIAVPGKPGTVHAPSQPYRAPFAIGATYRISQAFPSARTHNSPDSMYAVDIAMPEGTPVYSARAGTVIDVQHNFFAGAPSAEMMDQANVVEILHDDGTIAIYAHLQWDSIHVLPGQSVRRGEYIADSGNTGFTTGPHLHFAVIRNAGLHEVSVPIVFYGPAGTSISPVSGADLTAY
jgi:murein DD-endopeptidase MepM/ murein hydrolase activator NlpD